MRTLEASNEVYIGRRALRLHNRLPFECIALLLQGGGALGSYQGGVYEALAEAGLQPDWVAGISIGALNSAIIAGNPPDVRIERLRQFWESVTADPPLDWCHRVFPHLMRGDFGQSLTNRLNAARACV
jgi:NTE family protein